MTSFESDCVGVVRFAVDWKGEHPLEDVEEPLADAVPVSALIALVAPPSPPVPDAWPDEQAARTAASIIEGPRCCVVEACMGRIY
jgi:hypothetical protein